MQTQELTDDVLLAAAKEGLTIYQYIDKCHNVYQRGEGHRAQIDEMLSLWRDQTGVYRRTIAVLKNHVKQLKMHLSWHRKT